MILKERSLSGRTKTGTSITSSAIKTAHTITTMALHWPTFFTRLGSAIVFAIIMVGGLLWNSWVLLVLVSLITILCLREFFRIMDVITRVVAPVWLMLATIACSLLM